MAWWITPSGSVVNTGDQQALDYAMKNPGTFVLTPDDVMFATTRGRDGLDAVMDKLFYLGFICIEGVGDKLHITMLREDYLAYERIMGWLEHEHILDGVVVRFILWEGAGHRQWDQTVKNVKKGAQFARNPDRSITCPNCTRNIPKEQVLVQFRADGFKCPWCGQALA